MNDLTKSQYQYALDIIEQKTPSCLWTRLACERSFEDFVRQTTDEFPYFYDPLVGEKFRKFALQMRHFEGPKGDQPVVLDDWQYWLFSQLLGWKHDRGDNAGYRRFRTFHLEVARGNGKSFISSILALWGLCCDGEAGPQIYSAATDRRQASIVFGGTKAQVTNPQHEKLMTFLGVRALKAEIQCVKNNGKYTALSRDSSRMDGLNVHYAIVDELHAHPKRDTWDVLASGAKKRKQSLMVAITTAGLNIASFGFMQNEYVRMNLQSHPDTRDETLLGIIYCAEDGDDFYSEETWMKANPCWNTAIDKVSFRAAALKAHRIPSDRREFFTKNLNMWISGNVSWLDMDDLLKCRDDKINEKDKYDYRLCGFDLAYVNDLCCYVNVFVKNIDSKRHYYIFPKIYVPQRAIDENMNAKYPVWQEQKQLTVLPGEAIDIDEFNKDLFNNIVSNNISLTGGDAWQATPTMQFIQKKGKRVMAVPQTTKALTQATADFAVAVMEQRVHWNNDVFFWNCSNACLYIDNNDLFKPVKEHKDSNRKIDTVAAVINAIACGMLNNFGKSGAMIY